MAHPIISHVFQDNPSSYRLFTRWIYDVNNLGNVPSGTSCYSTSWRKTCRDLACTFVSAVMITISYAFIRSNCKKKRSKLHKAAINTWKLFVRHFANSFMTMDVLLQSPQNICFTLIFHLNMIALNMQGPNQHLNKLNGWLHGHYNLGIFIIL